MGHAGRLFVALAASCLLSWPGVGAREASAQQVAGYWTTFSPDHDLLGTPTGFGGSITWYFIDRVGVRAAFAQTEDNFESFGSTCIAFFLGPSECPEEPRSEASSLESVELSLPVRLYSFRWGSFTLVPGYSRVQLENVQTGKDTGRVRSADDSREYFHLGLEVLVFPFESQIGAVSVEAFGGSLGSKPELILDGYAPFNSAMTVRGLRVGLTLDLWQLIAPGDNVRRPNAQ